MGLGAAHIWAGWIVVSVHGLRNGLTHYDLTLLRFAVPAAVMSLWVLRHGFGGLAWHRVLLLGGLVGLPHAMFVQAGLLSSTPAHAAILLPGTTPLFAALFGWTLLRERLTGSNTVGLVLIVLGVLTIGLAALTGAGAGFTMPGDLAFLGASLVWVFFTFGLAAWRIAPFQAVAVVSIVSTVVYLPIYLVFLDGRLLEAPLSELALQGLYQGLIGILVAIALYSKCVELLGATRAALFTALTPALTALLAVPVLGEAPAWHEALGMVVVTIGMWLALNGRIWPPARAAERGPTTRNRFPSD